MKLEAPDNSSTEQPYEVVIVRDANGRAKYVDCWTLYEYLPIPDTGFPPEQPKQEKEK